eukprot:NODE_14402_length_447_cov_87.719136_g14103_i0.p1 GENE.NODE_14402_length_447_cov_87.719136_g14103_i0~~NODE_14402_length_447_cov_87.719136_g14103_i0.p1  ORF type:complete len:116 (-),score=4.17 NODE_14402_length_447_cov_87.719136_g14103_i0:5-352(-)
MQASRWDLPSVRAVGVELSSSDPLEASEVAGMRSHGRSIGELEQWVAPSYPKAMIMQYDRIAYATRLVVAIKVKLLLIGRVGLDLLLGGFEHGHEFFGCILPVVVHHILRSRTLR